MARHHRSHPGNHSRPARYPGTFLLAFQEALTGLHLQVRRWLGDAVACVDQDGNEQVVGLENLYRRARQVDRRDWPALITEFLTSLQASPDIDELPEQLAAVAQQLLPRLGPPLKSEVAEIQPWFHPLPGTDLGISLVVDYPSRMCYVTTKMVDDSGRPGSEWVEQAVANLRAQTPPQCLEMLDEDSRMLICCQGDAYDAARSLLLDHLLPEGREMGWLVAVPRRDEMFVLPVWEEALAHIHLLKFLTEKNFKTAPYPISDQIYWIHYGIWRRFLVALGPKRVTLQPPPEFLPILERLAPPREDAEPEPPAPSPEAE